MKITGSCMDNKHVLLILAYEQARQCNQTTLPGSGRRGQAKCHSYMTALLVRHSREESRSRQGKHEHEGK